MPDIERAKKIDGRKVLALIALAGAAVSAYNAGNYLSYVGIAYYVVCAAAVLFNSRVATGLLWAAVGAHAVLVGYGLWNWQAAHVKPCVYCFGAAGFALLAATVYTRPAAAAAPVFLMAITWYAWPYVFADKGQAADIIQQQTQTQTTGQQAENQLPDVNTDAAGENGKTGQGDQNVIASPQTEPLPGQTGVSTPAATSNDSGRGGGPGPSISGEDKPVDIPGDKPEEKPGSGEAEKTPDPDKPSGPDKPSEPDKPGSG